MSSSSHREKCFEQWEEACASCGFESDIEVHHIDGDASNNSRSNLIPLCIDCHRTVEANCWTSAELQREINSPLLAWLIKVKRNNSPNTEPTQRPNKNIKLDAAMYERLQDEKTQYETWNAFFDRLLSEVENDA